MFEVYVRTKAGWVFVFEGTQARAYLIARIYRDVFRYDEADVAVSHLG